MQVLGLDASNVEAIACIAADHFYSDQPELALRYYRRLLQVRGGCCARRRRRTECCSDARRTCAALCTCFLQPACCMHALAGRTTAHHTLRGPPQ